MRIREIRATQPPTPGSPPDWRTQLGQIVVEIETDDGLVGIGVGGGGAAGIHVVQTVLRDLLLGRDATDVEQLHAEICHHTSFYGRKGLVVMAISGVDLALWDLRGKTANLPVARLLNPNVDLQRELPTYSTVFDDTDAETAFKSGHQAIKLHVERFGNRPDPAVIADLVQRTRDRLGPDASVMIDAFARWDIDTSLRIADAIAPHDVAWLEEPIQPDDLDGYAVLAEKSPVPIAGGEHEYLADGFKTLIDRRLHAVLQPDISWCGGLTTLIDIYKMAQAANIRVVPHRGCEPYGLAAIAALDRNPLAESGRKWFNCLGGFPAICDGRISLSNEPGFGVARGDR
ncbi:MAG TPA: mandelate racemase/muconate lactonizing enzyme family protein [Pirellulaceae bacterium]|nr:mandelate racemase/muconate lactonizing enzyme family protein [Planctomycetales bacterium]MCB9937336.1 mandelate racemase/muconate lactonizing enzyme family protein [Planctomycetaceae bacterium]HRX80885.1 mandelate racemase/muconate lactonizing enzyme family protein [Pirellulaceae bacterium]